MEASVFRKIDSTCELSEERTEPFSEPYEPSGWCYNLDSLHLDYS